MYGTSPASVIEYAEGCYSVWKKLVFSLLSPPMGRSNIAMSVPSSKSSSDLTAHRSTVSREDGWTERRHFERRMCVRCMADFIMPDLARWTLRAPESWGQYNSLVDAQQWDITHNEASFTLNNSLSTLSISPFSKSQFHSLLLQHLLDLHDG